MSYNTSDRVSIRKTGQDESKIQKGIKLKQNGEKIRIAGAVMRVEVLPRKSGYGNEYKLKVWLPNFTEFEVTDYQGLMTFTQLMNALVEAATGQEPPKGAMEAETHVENGFPMKILKGEVDSKELVTVTASSDPKTEPLVPFVPKKKEETPEEERTEWNPETKRYEHKTKALPLKDKEDQADEDGTVILDPKEIPAGAAKSEEEDSVDLNDIAKDWHEKGYW